MKSRYGDKLLDDDASNDKDNPQNIKDKNASSTEDSKTPTKTKDAPVRVEGAMKIAKPNLDAKPAPFNAEKVDDQPLPAASDVTYDELLEELDDAIRSEPSKIDTDSSDAGELIVATAEDDVGIGADNDKDSVEDEATKTVVSGVLTQAEMGIKAKESQKTPQIEVASSQEEQSLLLPALEVKGLNVVFGEKPHLAQPLINEIVENKITGSREAMSLETGQDIRVINAGLSIEKGEMVALIGASNCGKSELLHAIAGLVPILNGDIFLTTMGRQHFEQQNIAKMGNHSMALRKIRRKHLSFMNANDPLLEWRSIGENVALGLEFCKISKNFHAELVLGTLKRFGLEKRSINVVNELSAFEKEQIKLARAMVKPCDVLLLENPFAGFSGHKQKEIFQILKSWQEETGAVILLALDNANLLNDFIDRKIYMEEGQIVSNLTGYDHILNPVLEASTETQKAMDDKLKKGLEERIRSEMELKLRSEIEGELRAQYDEKLHSEIAVKVNSKMQAIEQAKAASEAKAKAATRQAAKLNAMKADESAAQTALTAQTLSKEEKAALEEKISQELKAKLEIEYASKIKLETEAKAKEIAKTKAEMRSAKAKADELQAAIEQQKAELTKKVEEAQDMQKAFEVQRHQEVEAIQQAEKQEAQKAIEAAKALAAKEFATKEAAILKAADKELAAKEQAIKETFDKELAAKEMDLKAQAQVKAKAPPPSAIDQLTAKDVMEPQVLEIEANPIRFGRNQLQLGRFGIVKPNVAIKDMVKVSLQTGLPVLVEDEKETQIIGVVERDALLEALLR